MKLPSSLGFSLAFNAMICWQKNLTVNNRQGAAWFSLVPWWFLGAVVKEAKWVSGQSFRQAPSFAWTPETECAGSLGGNGVFECEAVVLECYEVVQGLVYEIEWGV